MLRFCITTILEFSSKLLIIKFKANFFGLTYFFLLLILDFTTQPATNNCSSKRVLCTFVITHCTYI